MTPFRQSLVPFNPVRIKDRTIMIGRDYIMDGRTVRLYAVKYGLCRVGSPDVIGESWWVSKEKLVRS